MTSSLPNGYFWQRPAGRISGRHLAVPDTNPSTKRRDPIFCRRLVTRLVQAGQGIEAGACRRAQLEQEPFEQFVHCEFGNAVAGGEELVAGLECVKRAVASWPGAAANLDGAGGNVD